MLKFKGSFENVNGGKYRSYQRKFDVFTTIPTVDEVDEALSFMAADAVLQILHGQAVYYGLGINNDSDDYAPVVPANPERDFKKRKFIPHAESKRSQETRETRRLLLWHKLARKAEKNKRKLAKLDTRLYIFTRKLLTPAQKKLVKILHVTMPYRDAVMKARELV